MSVNHAFAINHEKTKRFGKYFSSIDFELNPSPSKRLLEQQQENVQVGKLKIDTKEFNLTFEELDRIIETCQLAKTVFMQKFRFNK